MSLIPEVLRSRVVFAPTEDILVDIDYKTGDLDHMNKEDTECLMSTSPDQVNHPSTKDNYMSEICSIPLSADSSSSNTFSPLSNLQVLLPSKSINMGESSHPNASADSSAIHHTSHQLPVHSYSQAVVNIQDLQYPTELIPEMKSDDSVEFGPFESCDTAENESCQLADPLLPEAGFIEENLNLPPPLQPVVIQSVNKDIGNNN
ncbi:hypothetical protein CEXT_275271 [Caerostris extrusa]|uniref:Growth hormone receptor n=1 Tax=Caerostris extrusa TaxID=172846 RepID=A0AAV4WLR1_CAEEX|nr:hypothetical protein CEXT_275271 [Caerostris extrusa]